MARIVVVGAGLAGLACAEALRAAGQQVVVVEARHRVGGRVWTRRDGFGAQLAEAGAEFVNADHREVLALAARLGVATEPARPTHGRALVDAAGRIAPVDAWDEASHGKLRADLQAWDDALDAHATRIDPEDPVRAGAALDRRSAGDLLAELQLSALARLIVGRYLRTEFMVPPEEISLLHLAWERARELRCGTEGWECFRLAGGNDQLAIGLAAALGELVRLGQPVVAIGPTGVRLASGEVLPADVVVAAVPLPALARVAVEPRLPAEVLDVGYGEGGKVSVQVARRLWRDLHRDGSVVSDRAHGELWETSVAQPGDAGVITALMSSHDGAAMVALPDVVQRVTAEIERAFPGAAGLAGASCVTDWSNDGWSLGTYAAFAPGQLTRSWAALRRPHGTLVLAGEHTDAFAGYMEGALRSGARAARMALDLLGD